MQAIVKKKIMIKTVQLHPNNTEPNNRHQIQENTGFRAYLRADFCAANVSGVSDSAAAGRVAGMDDMRSNNSLHQWSGLDHSRNSR